jgi:hypothetical protein
MNRGTDEQMNRGTDEQRNRGSQCATKKYKEPIPAVQRRNASKQNKKRLHIVRGAFCIFKVRNFFGSWLFRFLVLVSRI